MAFIRITVIITPFMDSIHGVNEMLIISKYGNGC